MLPLQGAQVGSLVGELRSLMPRSVAKKEKEMYTRKLWDKGNILFLGLGGRWLFGWVHLMIICALIYISQTYNLFPLLYACHTLIFKGLKQKFNNLDNLNNSLMKKKIRVKFSVLLMSVGPNLCC